MLNDPNVINIYGSRMLAYLYLELPSILYLNLGSNDWPAPRGLWCS